VSQQQYGSHEFNVTSQTHSPSAEFSII